jgi:hypothetical protein
MSPEEIDQLAGICSDAALSEMGKRLFAAIVTDGVFENIVRGHPDPGSIAAEMGNDRIIEVATRELQSMTDAERDELMGAAADHLRKLIAAAGKCAFRAMRNGILSSDDLTPDFLARVAAVACVSQATK